MIYDLEDLLEADVYTSPENEVYYAIDDVCHNLEVPIVYAENVYRLEIIKINGRTYINEVAANSMFHHYNPIAYNILGEVLKLEDKLTKVLDILVNKKGNSTT